MCVSTACAALVGAEPQQVSSTGSSAFALMPSDYPLRASSLRSRPPLVERGVATADTALGQQRGQHQVRVGRAHYRPQRSKAARRAGPASGGAAHATIGVSCPRAARSAAPRAQSASASFLPGGRIWPKAARAPSRCRSTARASPRGFHRAAGLSMAGAIPQVRRQV